MSEEQQSLPIKLPKEHAKRAPTLYFIVGIKFLKGATALLLAIGALKLTDNNLPEDFRKLLEFFHLDPEKKFFLDVADRVSEITAANLRWVAMISIFYSLFMFLQAIGLAFRVSWIVWLVILESAFFVPIEVFELIRRHAPEAEHHPHIFTHPKLGVFVILLINIGIVWYLFQNRQRIIRHYHH